MLNNVSGSPVRVVRSAVHPIKKRITAFVESHIPSSVVAGILGTRAINGGAGPHSSLALLLKAFSEANTAGGTK